MIVEILKYCKHPQRPRTHMPPCTLAISWQVMNDMCSPNSRMVPSSTTNHVSCEAYSIQRDTFYTKIK